MSACASRVPGCAPELRAYLRDIDATGLLSREEERTLAGRIAQGDPTARDRLVRANLRLVVHIAKDYLGRGVAYEDLIAEGNLGLMRAAEGYDGEAGTRFSTYAAYWVKQSLRRAVINQGKPVRLPHHAVTLLSKWRTATRAFEEAQGRVPAAEEVAEMLRLPRKKLELVAQALEINRRLASVEASGEDEDALGSLADEGSEAAGDRAIASEDRERLLAGLGRLEGREATVLRMRFGLAPHAPMTLAEVGKCLGLTRERVRQIEDRAIEHLGAELLKRMRDDAANCAVAM
jgi:RNA polymerase primary sigma factor